MSTKEIVMSLLLALSLAINAATVATLVYYYYWISEIHGVLGHVFREVYSP